MPTYQYACPDCGTDFEKVQKFTDDPIKKCPKCGRKHVYRVVSKVAVSFKGSGWYITDSKSNNSAGSPGKDKDKAGEGETKTETNTETKAETTETKTPAAETTSTETTTKEAKPDKAEKPDKKAKKKAD